MHEVHRLLILLFLVIISTESYNFSACIPDTSCQCYLTQYSFTLVNCSHTLSDLPIFNSKTIPNITRIIARNALTQWPVQLCKYSNTQILDLSGSDFHSQLVDLSCLIHLIHLNLSNTQLNQIPIFQTNFSNHLQILDLSNNQIKILDGSYFQSLHHLISLFLQNNPIKSIEHLEILFNLSNIQSINLLSSNSDITLQQSLTVDQWFQIINQWRNSTKSFSIRMNYISFQTIIPNSELISKDSMKIIFKRLINSTFDTLVHTPKCDCLQLRNYQGIFSSINNRKKYSSALFQSTKCLTLNGRTPAPLLDHRTYFDLRCSLLSRISFFPFLRNSSSVLEYSFLSFFIFCLVLFY